MSNCCDYQNNDCVPCSRDKSCPIKLDASCVVYHILGEDDSASQLTCLGLPNGTTVETILEKIDDLICSGLNIPITVEETFTAKITANGQANHHLKTDVKVSADANNIIEIRPDGLYAQTTPQTPLIANDSSTIDFSTSGTANHTLTGNVKISSTAGNIIIANSDGIFAPTPAAETSLTANDSSTIDFSTSGTNNHTLTGSVKVSASAGNSIIINSDGLFADTGNNYTFQNGLTESSNIVEVGGILLHDTVITGDNSLVNSFSINTTQSTTNDNKPTNFTGFLIREGGTFSQTGSIGAEYGIGGQIWFNPSGTFTLRGGIASHSGIYGAAIKSGDGDLSNGMMSGGHFLCALAGAGNVDSMAGIRIGHIIDPPPELGDDFTGSITNYYGLYIEDAAASYGNPTNAYGAYIVGAGANFENVVNQDWTIISDERVKENIVDSAYGLEEINKLRVVEFNYINDETKDKQIGFIAQEVEMVIPEAVSSKPLNGLPDFKLLDKNVIFSILINAIKELSAKIEDLENKINE